MATRPGSSSVTTAVLTRASASTARMPRRRGRTGTTTTTTRCRTKYERALSEFHCGRCGEPLYSDQTRVETIFDDVIAALECSQCHQRDRETIGSLSDQRTLVCEGCATLIDIDGRALGLALGAAPHVLEGFWRDAAAVGGRVLREA